MCNYSCFSSRSSQASFQRNSRSSSSSLLSANSQRLSKVFPISLISIPLFFSGHHQLTEQHDHWWLDIPSSTIFRMPSCYTHQTTSLDVPIKNNGSVDITVSSVDLALNSNCDFSYLLVFINGTLFRIQVRVRRNINR